MSTPTPPRLEYQTPHRRPRFKWGYLLALAGAVGSSLVLLVFAALLFYGCTHASR